MIAARRVAPEGQVEGHPDGGNKQDHAHQAVHHRGDAGQQFHGGVDHLGQFGIGHLSQENGSHQTNGYADNNGACGTGK